MILNNFVNQTKRFNFDKTSVTLPVQLVPAIYVLSKAEVILVILSKRMHFYHELSFFRYVCLFTKYFDGPIIVLKKKSSTNEIY
jgi:hypothetical protein